MAQLTGTESSVESCPVLDVDINTAGTQALHIEMLDGQSPGDFYLSVNPLP